LEKQVAALQAAVTLINQTQNLNAVVSTEDVVYLPTTTFDVPADISIHFSKNNFSINSESLMILNEVMDILTRNPKWKVVINGLANDNDNLANNVELARNRGLEIQRMLLSAGIDPQQLVLHFPNPNDKQHGPKAVLSFVQL
jgi:outer membrane protein OmpA-like peptidoglycan-associated protein